MVFWIVLDECSIDSDPGIVDQQTDWPVANVSQHFLHKVTFRQIRPYRKYLDAMCLSQLIGQILQALETTQGDKREAARLLGISRAKIYQRLKAWEDEE